MDMNLCAQCQGIRQPPVSKRVSSSLAVHHKSWESFSAARNAGCRLCKDVWRRFKKNCRPSCCTPNKPLQGYFQTYYQLDFDGDGSTSLLRSLVFAFRCFDEEHFDWEPHSGWSYDVLEGREAATEGCGHESSRDAFLRQYVASESYLGSDTVYELIRSWVHCCEEAELASAQRRDASFLPKRLLDVGADNTDSVKLVGATGLPGSTAYIALSYCWGPSQNHVLMRTEVEQAAQNIEIAGLSTTAQDAIECTRRLGRRYLWIDALCIVQDDPDDWAREAARMQDVYGHAWLTIIASAASSSDQGFLREREVDQAMPILLPNPVNGQYIDGLTWRLVDADAWRDEVETSPLSARAWCVQERFLSLRTVFFGRNQVLWECHHMHACEMLPTGFPKRSLDGAGRNASYNRFVSVFSAIPVQIHSLISRNAPPSKTEVAALQEIWRHLVAQYTGCDLSFKDDRLFAISGIIALMEKALKSRNVAGLWEDDLIQELFWRRIGNAPEEGMPDPMIRLLPKAKPARAPSWSWLAVDGPVQYMDYPVGDRIILSRHDITELAEVIHVDVASSTSAGPATIAAGYIRLQCSLHKATVSRAALQETSTRILFKVGCHCGLITGAQVQADDILNEEILVGKTVWLMQLLSFSEGHKDPDFRDVLGGLVLTETKTALQFERFGRFEGEEGATVDDVKDAMRPDSVECCDGNMKLIDLV